MTKLIFAAIFAMTIFSCAQDKVQGDKDKERLDSVCDKFMQTFRDGNFSAAMEILKQNSVMVNSAIDTLGKTTKEQMNKVLASYGRMLSYECIREHKIKNF